MKKAINVLVLCLAFSGAARALEITGVVPAAVKGAAKADFSFSALTVKNVAWEKGAVIMPVTDNKGKKFTDIKLLSKNLYGKLETCFKNGCAPAKPGAAPKLKIGSFKPLKSPVRLANVELTFDGELLAVAGLMASKKEEGAF